MLAGVLILLAATPMPAAEPNLETAKQWWPDLPKKWTLIGWKEHIARFNVLFDGTIVNYFIQNPPSSPRPGICEPHAQFRFVPAVGPDKVPAFPAGGRGDYGEAVQGWRDCNTPVLWTEWAWHGYLLRSQVFAHVPGGQSLKRGDEPLFAWVRLLVHYKASAMPVERDFGFGVIINGYDQNTSMEIQHNLIGIPPKYSRDLNAEPEGYRAGEAFRVLEPDGRVRIAVAPGADCKAVFKAGAPCEADSLLFVKLQPREGAYVDLLVPMTPMDREVFDKELALGYDRALKEAEAFWSETPATAAKFDVPEEPINQAIRRNLQFMQLTAEKNPNTGDTYVVTGGLWYGNCTWPTPISIALAAFLDQMGYHSLVEKYLKPFKDAQGTVTPPGRAFKPHPGYLAAPPTHTFVNWLSDHGAILWVMAQHGLLTNDPAYVEQYTPAIIKACEWIQYARRIGGHGGVAGIMPPAVATDEDTQLQSCWTDGWVYKGLTTAVQFLKKIQHPRAAEFEAEAKDYKQAFQTAFRTKMAGMPTWTDSSGKEHRLAPYALSNQQDWHLRFVFHLDAGPMQLVFAGLMDARDPLMQDTVAWFREGPPAKLYRPYGDVWNHVHCLRHEMSTWEACYSWNIFHSWQLGDRRRFLEGMYSQFAGMLSQQTYTVCESRGGMTSNVLWGPVVYFARLAVIDDEIRPGELHLLRLCPLAWLRTDRQSSFANMPTVFGPVDLNVKLGSGGNELRVSFSGRFRQKPAKIVLHIPPIKGLRTVTVNGKPVKWDRKAESVAIR